MYAMEPVVRLKRFPSLAGGGGGSLFTIEKISAFGGAQIWDR